MERNSTSLSREGTQAFFLRPGIWDSIQEDGEDNQRSRSAAPCGVVLGWISAEAYAQADLCFGSEKARETSERLI